MTATLFRDDAYLRQARARVLAAGPDGIVLDRTVLYAAGGGQPGDRGAIAFAGGTITIIDTRKGDGEAILHQPAAGADLPRVGAEVEVSLDWTLRHLHMRMHTALHLLCAVVDGSVTGGQIGAERSRLDFDVPGTALDKVAIEAKLNALVAADHAIDGLWITQAELDANPALVRTMSVRPPSAGGRVRLVRIGSEGAPIDLQACGGTHVRTTSEIGRIQVAKIENKGKQNRRVSLVLP